MLPRLRLPGTLSWGMCGGEAMVARSTRVPASCAGVVVMGGGWVGRLTSAGWIMEWALGKSRSPPSKMMERRLARFSLGKRDRD